MLVYCFICIHIHRVLFVDFIVHRYLYGENIFMEILNTKNSCSKSERKQQICIYQKVWAFFLFEKRATNMYKSKIWKDTTIISRRQTFVEGFSTGLRNPPGKEKRLIVLHISSETGSVEGGLLLFVLKKTEDS